MRDAQTNPTKTDVQLFVDGRRVTTFAYDQTTDRMKYTPRGSLALGGHTVKVVTRDAVGNSVTKRWSFKVVQ